MNTVPDRVTDESDLLVPFEQQVLPSEYKDYYRTKRNNFFASIQKLPQLWDYYLMLDQIWFREIDVLKPSSPNRGFPVIVYINAHAKKDPALQLIWLNKLDDEEAFKKEFWYSKQTGLFAGLDELYEVWGKLSETGSHANLTSICERVRTVEVDGEPEWRLNYTGLAEKPWAMGIFDMLLIDFKMEETFFKDYQMRFQFDEKLLTMRREFEVYKEQIRTFLTTRYNVKRPEAPLIVP